jgi:cystathionine gamma-synthase
VVVFGFPYLDTLKLANVLHDAPARFWGHGSDADVDALAAQLEAGLSRPLAVYCEFPSNPLLRAPPLRRLRALCDVHGVPLVVDDSCAGVCNVDLLGPGGADMVVSSLTKQFCGAGTAMGGSLVLNRAARLAAPLKRAAERDYEPAMLFWRDAAVLLRCSMDLPQRARKSNATAVQLVSALKAHPRVRDVFHPSVDTERRQAFDEFRRKGDAAGRAVGGGGYGGIVSFVLRDPAHARTFFDAVDVPKGPGFGTNFSLLMLYTMLAHYHELPWAKQYGVDPNLMRLWCGQEDDLVERVLAALDALPAPAQV